VSGVYILSYSQQQMTLYLFQQLEQQLESPKRTQRRRAVSSARRDVRYQCAPSCRMSLCGLKTGCSC